MSDPFSSQRAEIQERLQGRYIAGVPHNQSLGLCVTDYGPERLSLELPYRDELVGYPDSGVLHGGCITSLIDGACGGAVILALNSPRRIATIDLRIDYVRPALPEQSVICDAHCYKVTRHVAFVRATAHNGEAANPIATASGTFVIYSDETKPSTSWGAV